MTSSAPAADLSATAPDPFSVRAQLLGALVALLVSVGVTFLWRALHWPAQVFASPIAFFLVMGSFFAWRSPRLRSRHWSVKVGVTLLHVVPALLVGWLSVALL